MFFSKKMKSPVSVFAKNAGNSLLRKMPHLAQAFFTQTEDLQKQPFADVFQKSVLV